jgi:transcription elongation GreA/GreB family factor
VSRAFVKEADGDAPALPDRPISPHRNFVTEAGLAAIEVALGRFEAVHRDAIAKDDRSAAAVASREVRYWRARRASAEVVKPTNQHQASFGMTVTLRRSDGREQSFRIVGEDEADPSRGTVSYVSPLARAVLNREPGETVEIAGQEVVLLTVRRENAKPGLD